MFFWAERLERLVVGDRGHDEISRARLLEPVNRLARRPVVWSHPAFANRSVYVRNDKEIVCVSLATEKR